MPYRTGQIYRPPIEANTPLLEVTAGCSYNACTFCSMYNRTKFCISPDDHIREDLEELAFFGRDRITRIYLLNGDPFCLSSERLLHIASMIHEHLPHVKTITCYASVRNILDKSVAELQALHKAGFDDLYVGIETVHDPTLKLFNKGCDSLDVSRAVSLLHSAHIRYIALLMAGAGGKQAREDNLRLAINFVNSTHPVGVSYIPTSVQPNTGLAIKQDAGMWEPLTERELLEDTLEFIEAINVPDGYPQCFFFASHTYNLVPTSGRIPSERKYMVQRLRGALDELDASVLDGHMDRSHI